MNVGNCNCRLLAAFVAKISLTFNVDWCIIYGMMSTVSNRYFGEDRVDMRFKPPHEHKTFKVAQLWDIHHEIVRRLALGETNVSIAKALGVSEAMVSYTKNSKPCQDKLDIMRGAMDADAIDLGIRINKFAPVALQLLENIITGKEKDASIGLRARYADRHLDRAGYSPVKKTANVNTTLTRDDIEAIKERSRKAAESSGVSVIDAEVVKDDD
jgi:predicted transcriptional regulator